MSDQCPRCGNAVYFAEELRALGTKWHKLCFKCGQCNKLLDSTTCADHDGEAYCKACYGKLFGPKGYGYAGGSSGLSMDTGKPYEVTRGNVSQLAQAQVAPLMDSNGMDKPKWGGSNQCPRCGKAVYFAEEIRAMGKKYHKLCLRCASCNTMLDSTTCTDHDDEIFCKACYGKKFGPKGYGFAGGASGLSMDTGNRYEVTKGNVSHLAQAQAAPMMETNGHDKPQYGNENACGRCGITVYFAEEIRAKGKKYHKLCLRCTSCNKMLDSTTCTDHDNQIYCKACYGRQFGPKGYGFAGGASGLSMDTGKLYEVTRENVSHLAQAQAAGLLESEGPHTQLSGAEICPRCGKSVYFAEKVAGGGKTYHKSCFKCSDCGRGLDSTTLCERENYIFCKSCYGKNYGPKGFGFGTVMQHST